ncbi:MAG TPA: NnrU family protein [Aestuariivirga sp.]
MFLLASGIVLFALPHFFSSLLVGPRDRLMARFGEAAYKGVYSAITGIGFFLMVVAYFIGRDSGEMLYAPAANMKHATMGLATLGIILISAGQGKSHIRLWLQNPFSIGIALWALGHLLSIGQFAADWFWITMLAVALVDIAVSMARGKRPEFQPLWRSDIIAIVVGLVITALLVLLFHPYVLGVNVVG